VPKADLHRSELIAPIASFIESGRTGTLTQYLVEHSSLPGRRANLELARAALDLHKRILERVCRAGNRRAKPFKTLRKGFGYTISVLVQAQPEAGFAWLNRLADARDPDVRWIVRQNLKKNRLTHNFPDQVAQLTESIDA
jgi:hypothetical protein